jgi:hypothetical protein
VERSLRRLKTDWIDILFLHEPSLQRLSQSNDILEQFSKLKELGLIRAFGLAGAWHGIDTLMTAAPELAQVVQTAEVDWPESYLPDVTYGAISGAAQNYIGSGIGAEIASERLRSALRRRPNGVVIVSTTRIGHLCDLAQAATDI